MSKFIFKILFFKIFFCVRDALNDLIFQNQKLAQADDITPETTLNTYLRKIAHLTGTKRMCLEGGCGCCVVAVEHTDPANKTKKIFAVNSVIK